MRVKIYATQLGDKPDWSNAALFLPEPRQGPLPPHPADGQWLYLATVNTLGQEAAKLSRTALSALQAQGFYIVESDPR